MIISAHHNQLVDGITPDGSGLFIDKINRKDEDSLSYNEIKENFTSSANEYITEINSLYLLALDEINLYLDKIKKTFRYINSAQFSLGLFVKYLYSCLIDADRLDAYLFEVKENYQPLNPNWDDLIKIFELKINSYSTDTKIGLVRHIISEKCKVASEKDTGIYQLSVPTGGGKTLSSMRFALHHAKKYNKKHIIYVIPYLSIIEQTAKNIRDMFEIEQNSPLLLEHHSNIALSDDDEKKDYQKLAASRWDNPIIITTMVQFLETVMSSRGSKLRKLHNMQDSIIIFDEIQFLPTNTVHLFNEVVSFLSKILDSTILLCTATQPLLGLTERRNLILPDKPYLIDEVEGCFKDLKRTQIVVESEKCIEDFAHFIIKNAKQNTNCLVIVNTKKYARDLFTILNKINEGFELMHLSTSMCSTHRFDVIQKIKDNLTKGIKVICVSTQLIEAGIDISFNCVIRAMAGLDSILQAAGRCNRNGESVNVKNVYVVPIKDENLDKLKDIKIGKEITQRIINENPAADFSTQEILNKYYDYYFFQRKNIMDFPTDKGESIYEMLSTNCIGKINYSNKTRNKFNQYIGHAFSSADENYYMIANNTQSVIVYYEESESLIEQYTNVTNIKDKINIIRKLEKFSVSLYRDYELKILTDNHAIDVIDDEFGLHILDKRYYDQQKGVVLKIDPKSLVI
jgi:CRISPR-associated endonuclease/helicase Cas3